MRTLPVLALPILLVAACSSSGGGAVADHRSRLVVHVTLSGGPMGADGQMAMSDSPDVNDLVTISGPSRRTWTARVDRHGDATFRLPAGQYRVSAGNCPARRAVSLGGDARVALHCDVP